MRRRATALLTVALLFGACGGDDDSGGDAASAEADQALADRVVLKAADLPEGWTVDPDSSDDEDTDFDLSDECELLESAFGSKEVDVNETGSADSDTFVTGDIAADGSTAQIQASVSVGKKTGDVADAIELFRDERVPGCLRELFQAGIDEGMAEDPSVDVKIGAIEADEFAAPDLGDDSVAYRMETTMTAAGFDFPVTVDLIVLHEGRVGIFAFLMFIGAGETPTDTVERALETMIGRITA